MSFLKNTATTRLKMKHASAADLASALCPSSTATM